MRRDVLRCDEPVERSGGVLLHGGFSGMLADAAAVAPVVEEQDVEASIVERERAGKRVSNGAIGGVEKECGGSGGCERVCGGGGDEPAVELGDAGGVVGEVEFGEVEADGRGRGGDSARGMEDELPLALIPEEAECAPGEEERDGEGDGEGFEEPARIDHLWRGALLR